MLSELLGLFVKRKKPVVYKLASIPRGNLEANKSFIKKLGGLEFSILYDFRDMKTFLIAVDFPEGLVESAARSVPGLSFARRGELRIDEMKNLFRYDGVPFKHFTIVNDPFASHEAEAAKKEGLFDDLAPAFRNSSGYILVSLRPASLLLLDGIRRYWEGELTRLSPVSREGVSSQNAYRNASRSETYERTRYADTDRAMRASEIVAMCNNAILHGDGVYRVSVFGWGEDAHLLKQHLVWKYAGALKKAKVTESLRRGMPEHDGEVLSGEYAADFINFNSSFAREEIAIGVRPIPKDALADTENSAGIGRELLSGVEEGGPVHLNPISFNTNIAIVGQQRMGKTLLGKKIAKSAIRSGAGVIVFSPSGEWASLCRENDRMLSIRLAEKVPFNLVRCPHGVRKEQYYQNLALLLANAMGAGPYTNPLRNVMLNSLTSLYSGSGKKNLVGVYDSINAGIVEFYAYDRSRGKESFGKFGQNIRASLENLRQIVLKEQFRADEGIRIEDCIKNGAVFDLSDCSELERALLYAFILAQIYSYILSKFDEKGDMQLRLLIILEEAHMIFGKHTEVDAESTATVDLEKKLGMFGKRGVGIVFITHFADQISETIRRHAQTHFYFKQDSEALESALKDLKFNRNDSKEWCDAGAKVLSLPTGVAACRAVHISASGERVEIGPFFIKTSVEEGEEANSKEADRRIARYFKSRGIRKRRRIRTAIKVVSKENGETIAGAKVELSLCGNIFGLGETSLDQRRDAAASFDCFENEEYEVRVMKEGFKTAKGKLVASRHADNIFELEFSEGRKKELRDGKMPALGFRVGSGKA